MQYYSYMECDWLDFWGPSTQRKLPVIPVARLSMMKKTWGHGSPVIKSTWEWQLKSSGFTEDFPSYKPALIVNAQLPSLIPREPRGRTPPGVPDLWPRSPEPARNSKVFWQQLQGIQWWRLLPTSTKLLKLHHICVTCWLNRNSQALEEMPRNMEGLGIQPADLQWCIWKKSLQAPQKRLQFSSKLSANCQIITLWSPQFRQVKSEENRWDTRDLAGLQRKRKILKDRRIIQFRWLERKQDLEPPTADILAIYSHSIHICCGSTPGKLCQKPVWWQYRNTKKMQKSNIVLQILLNCFS